MLLRSTFIYGPAILLTRISALLVLVVVTRLITQEEYGLLTLVVAVGEMTDAAVTNWLRIALLRLGGKGDVSRGSLVLAGKVLLISTALAMVIAAAVSAFVVPERALEFAFAVCTYLVVSAIARFSLTVLQMQQRHSAYSLLECLRALLQLALPIGAIIVFPASFLVVSLGSSAGMLIAGLASGFVASRRVVVGPSRFTRNELVILALPLVGMAVVGFGMTSAERLLLNAFRDASAVAVFAAAYVLARQPIDMISNAINIGAFPEAMNRFDEQGPVAAGALLARVMALQVQLCLPIAAMLVALSAPISEFLLPDSYHGHVGPLFPVIAFSVVCSNLASFVYGSVIHAHKRPQLLIFTLLLGSMATITLSLFLIPQWAELGAALALAGCSLVEVTACAFVSRRLTIIPTPWLEIAISLTISLLTGVAARLATSLSHELPVLLSLAFGGAAGCTTFLLTTWLFHPRAAHRLIEIARKFR